MGLVKKAEPWLFIKRGVKFLSIKKQGLTAALLSVGVLAISLGSCMAPLIPTQQVTYTDGTYRGTAAGMMGDVTVEVVVKDHAISSIVLKEHKETDGIYQKAEQGVIASILENQSTEVDAVSGATKTSDAIMKAVEDALKDAAKA